MSQFSIKQYQSEVEKIIHFGGTKKETAIRNAFYNLLNEYAKQKGLMMVAEVTIKTKTGKNVTPDGTLKDTLRQDWGYWESKDESDKIDDEIKKKFDKGYPKDNILFEDSHTAILYQNGLETARVSMSDPEALHRVITEFISFERPEVRNFRKAIELFKQDIPKVTETLRGIIIDAEKSNLKFIKASEVFLKLCHDSINPAVTNEDVREMIIQHILTEDVFNTIFDENQFHRENNIARELESVIHTFFTGAIRKTALANIQHYYQAINAAAAGIADHHEKQKFLKVIYETFYKSYNPKAADRLGVVYTPNEIVNFMIESTDYLLHKHFGKYLEDKGVEILDPATGTGTFICDIIDYLRKEKLEYKYRNEIHANEVAILPYYISNLNIEYTYTQKMGAYAEFANLCFVDTLDNMGFGYRGKQIDMFAPFTEENTKRIKNQNDKKIAVIIGNPPYNANQTNENDNNKNREYPAIDKRIKDTFIEQSTAQKTKVYDMYARFYRWAFDRLDNNGVVAFVTNRSFIDGKTFDGFRKTIQTEFDSAYIIDLGGDIRTKSEEGVTGNVFGIRTGVAIMFLVKKFKGLNDSCRIEYVSVNDGLKGDEKLRWLSESKLTALSFEIIRPDKKSNWINLSDNDFESLIPTCSKSVKNNQNKNGDQAIFKLFSNGVSTNRDEWILDFSDSNLLNKAKYFCDFYNALSPKYDKWELKIKWSRNLKRRLSQNRKEVFSKERIGKMFYRPFVMKYFYNSDLFIDEKGAANDTFRGHNSVILVSTGQRGDFEALASNAPPSLDIFLPNGAQYLPLYRYDTNGNPIENITDWGFNKFVKQYGKKGMSKQAIFHYVYAVLHYPVYRTKYELNLKREFPRIPFYEDFKQWAAWGKALMDIHINYETVKPYNLKVTTSGEIESPKAKLKADKESGVIILDENTTLKGIPPEAWEYKLGNRSALEWVLDQYKEKKVSDPTIAAKFDTYRFADYKPEVIDLLKRVCTVSIETMKIIKEMPQ